MSIYKKKKIFYFNWNSVYLETISFGTLIILLNGFFNMKTFLHFAMS